MLHLAAGHSLQGRADAAWCHCSQLAAPHAVCMRLTPAVSRPCRGCPQVLSAQQLLSERDAQLQLLEARLAAQQEQERLQPAQLPQHAPAKGAHQSSLALADAAPSPAPLPAGGGYLPLDGGPSPGSSRAASPLMLAALRVPPRDPVLGQHLLGDAGGWAGTCCGLPVPLADPPSTCPPPPPSPTPPPTPIPTPSLPAFP
jgi:hypothetical protein